MRVVWKFTLEDFDNASISMPRGAQILKVDVQYGSVRLWALCDPNAEEESRHFCVFGTGHTIHDADNLQYLGTFFSETKALVFHVFEELGQ